MSNQDKETINQKIERLNAEVDWFYSEDFSLDDAITNYKKSIKLADEIKSDLKGLKNEVSVLSKDFSKN
ncbi:exodeoxyribonuclease VII small subunit [Candidatus Saccharibacteria bacterium]|nr:exodeoxyribonuclease VII small subunit [Candidatus Saccharibacteria bacterium]